MGRLVARDQVDDHELQAGGDHHVAHGEHGQAEPLAGEELHPADRPGEHGGGHPRLQFPGDRGSRHEHRAECQHEAEGEHRHDEELGGDGLEFRDAQAGRAVVDLAGKHGEPPEPEPGEGDPDEGDEGQRDDELLAGRLPHRCPGDGEHGTHGSPPSSSMKR